MPTVGIVGLGLMGSSFALALKKARPDITVLGNDRNPVVVQKALVREIVSTADVDPEVLAVADVVFVAAPINALRTVFAEIAVVAEGKPVTDMAITKATVVEWAAAEGLNLIGGHPMCGREASRSKTKRLAASASMGFRCHGRRSIAATLGQRCVCFLACWPRSGSRAS